MKKREGETERDREKERAREYDCSRRREKCVLERETESEY